MCSSLVKIVRHVGDSDVKALTDPMPREDALNLMRAVAEDNPGEEFELDLVSVETGRFVSWVL
jgi:hypothetical protein